MAHGVRFATLPQLSWARSDSLLFRVQAVSAGASLAPAVVMVRDTVPRAFGLFPSYPRQTRHLAIELPDKYSRPTSRVGSAKRLYAKFKY